MQSTRCNGVNATGIYSNKRLLFVVLSSMELVVVMLSSSMEVVVVMLSSSMEVVVAIIVVVAAATSPLSSEQP